MFQHDPAISSTISNVYGMCRSRERLTGNCRSSRKAALSCGDCCGGGQGHAGEMRVLWPSPLRRDLKHMGQAGTEGPAGGTRIMNRLQKETHLRALAQ